MRKQTKIAAIVSAAALLAIGASMTAFAATGWQEEDGTWKYYNKNEEQVTDSWEKSGDNWFYLDDAGEMATDALIEDDDNYYYVDANGAMVRNQWVAIDNEDAGEENEPDVWWYYFQQNGKALKNKHAGRIFKKVINGKTYAFDEDGKMQYGWISTAGEMNHEDSAYAECDYYFGDENDGAMSSGWREIALTDADAADAQPGVSFWDEDQVRWFYFASSGKKYKEKAGKTINGKKYGFDQAGRMIADWAVGTNSDSTAASGSNASAFSYYSTPEDGARYTKGWFKVVPGYYLNMKDYDDGEDNWYYADGEGKLVVGQLKSIKGKKYAFDDKGAMISGLALLKVSGNTIEDYVDDDTYDTEEEFDDRVDNEVKNGYGFYFFSNDEDHDGTMKTGIQKITIDGDSFTFKFTKSGEKKGQGLTKLDDKKFYYGGKLLSASSDNKVEVVSYEDKDGSRVPSAKTSVGKFLSENKDKFEKMTGTKNNKDYVKYTAEAGIGGFAVVGTSGTQVNSGTKKDGEGYKVVVKGGKIVEIIIED